LRSFNVSSYAGQTVTISFSGVEDSSLQTSFVIDDAAVNVA
jgi:serine protease